MYELSDRGLLGNVLPTMTWRQFAEWSVFVVDKTGRMPPGRFGLRHRNIIGFPWTRPVGNARKFARYVGKLLKAKLLREEDVCVTVITDLPEEKRTLQGEIWVEPGQGLMLGWSGWLCNPYTCREEMRQPAGVVEMSGMVAKGLLDTFMDANSRAWADELLETYPGHVIEFSSFSRKLGLFGWNTLFWEVRYY
jgi:hypothetical protein